MVQIILLSGLLFTALSIYMFALMHFRFHLKSANQDGKLRQNTVHRKEKRKNLKFDQSTNSYDFIKQLSTFQPDVKGDLHWNYVGTESHVLIPCEPDKTIRLLHVINPFYSQDADSVATQNMSMHSLDVARQWLKNNQNRDDVSPSSADIMTVENRDSMADLTRRPLRPPSFLSYSPGLTLSAADRFPTSNTTLNGLLDVNKLARYPLLREILSAALSTAQQQVLDPASNSLVDRHTHVVFTNMDINAVPEFYAAVADLLRCKDAFLVNRYRQS